METINLENLEKIINDPDFSIKLLEKIKELTNERDNLFAELSELKNCDSDMLYKYMGNEVAMFNDKTDVQVATFINVLVAYKITGINRYDILKSAIFRHELGPQTGYYWRFI